MVSGYHKISLLNHEIRVPKVPLREEVEVHLVPDTQREALEVRIWWENQMVQSITYPLKEFPRVHFSKVPNTGCGEGNYPKASTSFAIRHPDLLDHNCINRANPLRLAQ